jgi:chromatin segregation and condensation protein Rec8/ScpA/Scc1 (kleisin family)
MKGKSTRPNLGYGTKDEKRNKKRQKLVEQLNQKREAQAAARQYVPEPTLGEAVVGREMYEILGAIQQTPIQDQVARIAPPDERQLRAQAIAEMQTQLGHPEFFANPEAVFDATWEQLSAKAAAIPAPPPHRKAKPH